MMSERYEFSSAAAQQAAEVLEQNSASIDRYLKSLEKTLEKANGAWQADSAGKYLGGIGNNIKAAAGLAERGRTVAAIIHQADKNYTAGEQNNSDMMAETLSLFG